MNVLVRQKGKGDVLMNKDVIDVAVTIKDQGIIIYEKDGKFIIQYSKSDTITLQPISPNTIQVS